MCCACNNIRYCNIIAQLETLYEIKEEYLKLLVDVQGDITNSKISNIFDKFDNKIENKTIEYKTHPIAKTIKECFVNMDDGVLIGFRKSYFSKRYQVNGDIFRIFDKTENYWNWKFIY